MTIEELAERTGVGVATLRHYVRLGLVPAGDGADGEDFPAGHVERVRLVHALHELAHLPLTETHRILELMERTPGERIEILADAHQSLLDVDAHRSTHGPPVADAGWHAQVIRLLEEVGWEHCDDLVDRLAIQLREAALLDPDDLMAMVRSWLPGMQDVARADVESLSIDPENAVKRIVAGTLVSDPILLTLRRMAQRELAVRQLLG